MRLMKRIISIMAIMLLAAQVLTAGQTWKNETLRYALYIGPIKAGEAAFITKNTTFEGQKAVQMELRIRTTSAAEKIFSVNDTITSYIDPQNTRPIYYRKHSFEGDNHYQEFARYTYPDAGGCRVAMRKIYRDGRVRENTENSRVNVYDLVSVMAYARSIKTTGFMAGKRINYRFVDAADVIDECMIYEGRVRENTENSRVNVYDLVSVMAYARSIKTTGFMAGKRINYRFVDAADVIDECMIYEGRETVKVSGVKYDCIVFRFVEPYIEKGKTKYKEVLTIYMTDDDARTIVEMDIKYKVGSAKAKLIR